MTEEIIIDGVDVAGCYHFGVFGGGMCGLSECGGLCKDFNNCLYKQLKRLEQENEAYKQSEQEAIEIIADLKHQLSLFKQSRKTEQDRRRKFENALEEIRDYLNALSSVDSDFVNTETYLRIQDKIKEVLNG